MRCYIADFRLYSNNSMVYSLFGGPWVVKEALFGSWVVKNAFFWLYRPFFGYIPPSIAKYHDVSEKKVVCC